MPQKIKATIYDDYIIVTQGTVKKKLLNTAISQRYIDELVAFGGLKLKDIRTMKKKMGQVV